MLSSIYTELTVSSLLICTLVSVTLGLVIAAVHRFTTGGSKNFAVTLAVLPVLVQVVMMMVNGNIGTGIAIMGAFSLVRFRSIPGTSREIVSVFFAMAIGLASGTGYIAVAAIATAVISMLLLVLSKTRLFAASNAQWLRITVPEDFAGTAELEEVFKKHNISASFQLMKTKNMGSLFELGYKVEAKSPNAYKPLIDDLRIKNNNLPIQMTTYEASEGGL